MYLSTKELLTRSPFEPTDPMYDRLFISAKVSRSDSDNSYQFFIDSETPAVRLNSKVDLLDNPTVADMKTSNDLSLVSSNMIICFEDHGQQIIPLLLRDEGAPVYPNHLTTPAGRCDNLPRQTAIAEGNQEIIAIAREEGSGEKTIVGFGLPADILAARRHHLHCLGDKFPKDLPVENWPIRWIPGPDHYSVIEEIVVEDDGRSHLHHNFLESGDAWIIYDPDTNAYEICFMGIVSLPTNWRLVDFIDGDGFGRSIKTVHSLTELKDQQCVPALNGLIQRLFE